MDHIIWRHTRNIANNSRKFNFSIYTADNTVSNKDNFFFCFYGFSIYFFLGGASNAVLSFLIVIDTLVVLADFRSDSDGSLVTEFGESNYVHLFWRFL